MRLLILCLAATPLFAGWKSAEPGWAYAFPRDHGSHPEFKTEWWYFTGNVKAEDGRAFGWQLTFFRQGVLDPDGDFIPLSRFVTREVKLAHFAVSDLDRKKFLFFQKASRGAFGEAGFGDNTRLAWNDDWSCEQTAPDAFRLRAASGEEALDLELHSQSAPLIHGEGGISRKGGGRGDASCYYSLSRLKASGVIQTGGEKFSVKGSGWFDHEWASNPLGAEQAGWDWFGLQFDDGSDLMLFQLRVKNGGRDIHSAGTFRDAQGGTVAVASADFELEPVRWWKSPATGGTYPVEWRLSVPKLNLNVRVRAAMDSQELALVPVNYWEGAVRAEGKRAGNPVAAQGYLEMTGYAGPIVGLQAGGAYVK